MSEQALAFDPLDVIARGGLTVAIRRVRVVWQTPPTQSLADLGPAGSRARFLQSVEWIESKTMGDSKQTIER